MEYDFQYDFLITSKSANQMFKNKNMKKINIILFAFVGLFFFVSCDNEETVLLPSLGEIQVEKGYGEVIFYWDFPQDNEAEYIRVDYTDNGESKWRNFSKYAKKAIIPNLSATEYEFKISVADKNGNLSEPKIVKVTPDEPAYLMVARTFEAEPTFGGIIVTWKNETGIKVRVNVKYLDSEGFEQVYSVESSDVDGKAVVTKDVPIENQEFRVFSSNPSNYDQRSEEVVFSIKPWKLIKFEDKSTWTVVSVDSHDGSNVPEYLFDDDLSTFWQTNWVAGHPFPHHVAFDMKKERIVCRVGFYNRDHNNANNAMQKFKIEGSLDNENWTVYGEFDDFPTDRKVEIIYDLPSTPVMRYMRITALTARNNVAYLALAEINVYGAYLE
ncbi:MAG TPA: discoidin domain-containing protein [Dysgonamonadaceae bacterium]|nr:discoidin domain-containing protein [Dysgonamonadaceae bacterium]